MSFDTDQYDSTIDRIPIYSNSDDENEPDDNKDAESNESFEFDDIYEDYSTPAFELPSYYNIFKDSQFMWILLWIMNFRMKFNLSNTATEALIKFMKLVLIKINGTKFEDFCESLYTIKKLLELSDQFVNFVACQKCHKLYKKEDVVDFQQNNWPSIMNCTHIEFPNSTTRRSYNTILSIQSKLLNGSIVNWLELYMWLN